MKAKTALFLVPDLRNPQCKGGIQVFNNFFLQALRDLGVKTTVIGVNDRPQDRVPGLIPCSRNRRLRKPTMAVRALWHSAIRRPDLVICGHLNFTPLSSVIHRLLRLPVLTITHGRELWYSTPKQIASVRRSAGILAVSRYTRGLNLEQLPGYPPEQVMVFHNTFDADRFIPGPPDWDYLRRLGLDPSNFIVLTVGRLNQDEPHKGHEQGIRAMADVVKQHPQARFVLAGSGNGDEYFRSVGDDVGLGDKLIMPGFVSMDELQTLFNACNLFLLPSSQEGFGIVFLEAMGCGKPVIGGNIDGSVDPLCDGELGTLIDPREIDEIVAAITDHIEQRIPKDKIDPVHLRKEAISRFGYDRFRQRLREVIAAL